MLAYIANTVVFFLVGVVIATQVHGAPLSEVFVILGAFVGVVLIRFLVTFAFPVSAIWFADQFAATNANLMGVSLVNVSSRQIRTIGWVALVLGSIAFLVLSLPHAFPRAA